MSTHMQGLVLFNEYILLVLFIKYVFPMCLYDTNGVVCTIASAR